MIRRLAIAVILAAAAACASHPPPAAAPTAPKYPSFLKPDVPAGLNVPADVRQRQEDAWMRLQAGDLRGASRDFGDVLKRAPEFYPAEAGLGYAALADRQYKQAAARFATALKRNGSYLPALQGQVDAELGDGDDPGAIAAIEQLLAVDPRRDELRNRLDLLRLRTIQSDLDAAAKSRSAGRLDDAQRTLERALESAPSSPIVLRELARVELSRNALEAAEDHARKAAQLDGADAEAAALLAGVLEAEGKSRDASDMYGRAFGLDPRPAWREKRDALKARADIEALPADYREIGTAASVTRGQVAAMIGIDLKTLLDAAPKRPSVVITDIRSHWAAPWILPVTQAGLMDVLPNHTFQPNAAVRRSDLAQITSQLLTIAGARRAADLASWRAARPRLADVPAAHVSYRAIAAVTTAGVMKVDDAGKFWPTRPASGADLTAAVARLRQLAGR